MVLDPEDEERMNRLVQDMLILQSKYTPEIFGQFLVQSLMSNVMASNLIDMDDERKAYFMGVAAQGFAEGAQIGTQAMHDQLFPFGHPGQAIEISE